MLYLTSKNDHLIITLRFFTGMAWTTLFYLAGSHVAAYVILLTTIRMGLCKKYFNNIYLSVFFIFMYVALGINTYESIKDAFAILGGIFGTIAFMHYRKIKMRMVLIVASFCWVIHNYMAGFISATLVETMAITINIVTIYRINAENNKMQNTQTIGTP